jgi:hypothetical protein
MTEKHTENSERADSGATAPVPKGHPLMKAWEKFKASDEFANSKRWAAHPEHLDGSLWALFDAGWNAGLSAAMGMEPIYTEPPDGVQTAQAPSGHGNLVICVPHGVWDCPKCHERNAGLPRGGQPE